MRGSIILEVTQSLLARNNRGKYAEAATGGVTPATLLKKRLLHRRFPINFAKF